MEGCTQNVNDQRAYPLLGGRQDPGGSPPPFLVYPSSAFSRALCVQPLALANHPENSAVEIEHALSIATDQNNSETVAVKFMLVLAWRCPSRTLSKTRKRQNHTIWTFSLQNVYCRCSSDHANVYLLIQLVFCFLFVNEFCWCLRLSLPS